MTADRTATRERWLAPVAIALAVAVTVVVSLVLHQSTPPRVLASTFCPPRPPEHRQAVPTLVADQPAPVEACRHHAFNYLPRSSVPINFRLVGQRRLTAPQRVRLDQLLRTLPAAAGGHDDAPSRTLVFLRLSTRSGGSLRWWVDASSRASVGGSTRQPSPALVRFAAGL